MRTKLNIILPVLMALSLALSGCAPEAETPAAPMETASEEAPAVVEEEEEPVVEEEAVEEPASETRTITDLAGYTVELPPADEIKRVVIISPPLLSTYVKVVQDTSMLVGTHPRCISSMNHYLQELLVPNAADISTTFLTGFTSNTEELLKLEPDVILVYGDFQKGGLENVDIPIVDFFITDQQNETWSVKIDTLMHEIFGIENDNSLSAEWEIAKENATAILDQVEDTETQRGLMIMSNTGDSITVRGAGNYGDDWLLTSGLVNAAGEMEGDGLEVSMEQIYEWNPDIIYVFQGLPASSYLDNSIEGQDWSPITAIQAGRVYDTPSGMMDWGAPNSDSPLMLQWLISKNFPEIFPEEEFVSIMKEYYDNYYGITLTDEMVFSILNKNAED